MAKDERDEDMNKDTGSGEESQEKQPEKRRVGASFGKSAEDKFKFSLLQIEKRFVGLEKRIGAMQTQVAHPDEVQGLRARIDALQNHLNVLQNVKPEIEVLRSKIEPQNAETIKSIVNELADLRIETSRDIREIKEKIGNAPLYADIQFLSNRVKDLKMNMDNLLNMKVEIDSKILNIERSLAETGGGGGSAGSSSLITELELTKRDLMIQSKKLGSIERMMHEMTNKINSLNSLSGINVNERMGKLKEEIEDIYEKVNEMHADLQNKFAEISDRGMISQTLQIPQRVEEDVGHMQTEFNSIQDEVKQLRVEMHHAISRMQSQSVSKTASDVEVLKKRMSDMEDNIQSLNQSDHSDYSARMRPAASDRISGRIYDEQISQLLQRILFLETKLGAFEQILQKQQEAFSQKEMYMRPMILE